MKINYGIVALNDDGEIVHFCGYENEPQKTDIDSLKIELANDPEFGFVGVNLKFAMATPEILNFYASVVLNNEQF